MLGWALDLGFAGGVGAAVATALHKAHVWIAAYLYPLAGPRGPVQRPNWVSFGTTAVVPGTLVADVVVVAEGVAAPPARRAVNLARLVGAETPPADYRLITETSGETLI